MKTLFDIVSYECSKIVTTNYSTSFSLATRMLSPEIRSHIYNIYGFVRFADEIVDTFHDYSKEELLDRFERDLYHSLEHKISLNPILNAFQHTVNYHNIDIALIQAFLKSMRWDLTKSTYDNELDYHEYIYGSADVVGLMCLKVFVNGNSDEYEKLRPAAMALGSAFQKVNFLRDLKADHQGLERSYFPNFNFSHFDESAKSEIIQEIENDFKLALEGIYDLPNEARFGVYTAYKYYSKLLLKLKKTTSVNIKTKRIRVPNYQKMGVFAKSYLRYHLNLI